MENVIQIRPTSRLSVTAPAPAGPIGQNYGEWSFFDGYAFSHIAAWQENARVAGLWRAASRAAAMNERRKGSRGIHP